MKNAECSNAEERGPNTAGLMLESVNFIIHGYIYIHGLLASIFSVAFPATVMSRDRYRTISWNVHMSGPGQ